VSALRFQDRPSPNFDTRTRAIDLVVLHYTGMQDGETALAPRYADVGFEDSLLGYYNDKKQLVYAGRVGTGFDDKMLGDMLKQMKALSVDKPPTDVPPPPRERRAAHWIKPTLVGEVRFTGWTRDNYLRHPAFIALRSDKKATAIVREKAVDPEKVENLTPSPGTPGEGRGEGSAYRSKRSKTSRARSTANPKPTRNGHRTLTQPSPGVPGEGTDSHHRHDHALLRQCRAIRADQLHDHLVAAGLGK